MTNHAQPSLEIIETVSERSPALIGFEPTTVAFRIDRPDERDALLAAYHDAKTAGRPVFVVQRGNHCTVWTQVNDFWE